jgi:hypothetical protein
MLYTNELLEYIKHFPLLQLWDSEKVYDNVSYNDVYYLIEDAANNENVLYELQTKLSNINFLKNGEIKDAFGIAIDVDTKDRDNGITVENLTNSKKVASMIVKKFMEYGIKSILKFSGGGYHILLIFDEGILGDYLDIKNFKEDVINKILNEVSYDKSLVKDVEVKHDQIRSLFSYNRKYKNYSVPAEINQPVEIDLERSTAYLKFNFDFNKAVNILIESSLFADKIVKAEIKKQKTSKFKQVADVVEQAIDAIMPNDKENLTDDEIKKLITLVRPRVNATPVYIISVAKAIAKYKKSISLYDEIFNRGVKDGRKRLLIYVIIPYLNIKYNGNKEKMEEEAYNWLKRSNVNEGELYKYRNEINSLIANIISGVRPTSVQSLLSRFNIDKDTFIKEYMM